MHRREFMTMVVGALAAGVVSGCAAGIVDSGAWVPAGSSGNPAALKLDAAAWRAASRTRRSATLPMSNAAVARRRCSCTGFRSTASSGAASWNGWRRIAAASLPTFLVWATSEVAEGQSVAPDAQVAMLVALLDTLGVASVDIIANDSGGAVAQLFLVRHPQRVRTVLLTTCDAEIDCPPPALVPVIDLAREGRFVKEWLAPWLADKALARSPEGLGGMTFTYPSNPTDEAIDYYLSPLVNNAARTHAYALGLEKNSLAGIEPLLKRSTAPTRIVWGTGDTIFSPESPGYLDRTLGNARGVRKVEGAKLFFPEEFPDLIAEEARRLWGVA